MLSGERGVIQNRPDYFLAHRPLQPKNEVADYVESQGILVPQRFSGLAEALGSGKPFIVRSEHPQDYDGASGVFESLHISPERMKKAAEDLKPGMWRLYHFAPGEDPRDFARLVLEINQLDQQEIETRLTAISLGNAQVYCRYAEIPLDSFMQQASYSYWEAVPGVNRTVVADSAIEGRYHISSAFENVQMDPAKAGQRDNYLIVENGEIIAGDPQEIPEDTPENIRALIEAYEKVRSLERFSPDNCPIVEIQSNGDSQYFLQYLRGRDFQPPGFVIDRDPEDGEIKSTLTRGATPPEGLEVAVTIIIKLFSSDAEIPDTEATINWYVLPMFVEPLVKRSRVQIVPTGYPVDIYTENQGHMPRSVLFKPEITTLFLTSDLMRVMSKYSGYPEVGDGRGSNVFRARIVSDGRKAYLKRIA